MTERQMTEMDTCDVCHFYTETVTVERDGKRSRRCATHADPKFDNAAVWR